MKRISSIIKNNNRLIKNFSYLSVLKVVTMFLPIFTYPYLISTLGTSNYGLVIYSQAIIGYFVIFINFGFSITTTREISKNRDNIDKLSQIISTTYIIKILIFLFCLLILATLSLFIIDIKENIALFFYTMMWLAMYEVLFPSYYFQGIEEMKYITLVSLVSRLIFFVSIFIFIKDKDDYILFPILNFLGSTVAIIISIYILIKDGIYFVRPTLKDIQYHLKSSYTMGLAMGSNTLKSNLNIVLIKNVLSLKEVAIFDLCFKLISIGITITDLISQTVFPKIAKEKNKTFFNKLMKFIYVMSFLLVIGYFLFGKIAIKILSGDLMLEAYNILLLMSLIVPIYSVGTMLGRNCLNIYGYDRHVLYSMIISSAVYVFCYILLKDLINVEFNIMIFVVLYLFSFLIDTLYRLYISKKYNLI